MSVSYELSKDNPRDIITNISPTVTHNCIFVSLYDRILFCDWSIHRNMKYLYVTDGSRSSFSHNKLKKKDPLIFGSPILPPPLHSSIYYRLIGTTNQGIMLLFKVIKWLPTVTALHFYLLLCFLLTVYICRLHNLKKKFE